MLQLINGKIMEPPPALVPGKTHFEPSFGEPPVTGGAVFTNSSQTISGFPPTITSTPPQSGSLFGNYIYYDPNTGYCHPYNQVVTWLTYPVYVCQDKTAKAIEILKTLQEEGIIDVKSVPKFIKLVEKISSKL